jgi:DNA segregation ATPase FtsK/SpoIIIE, S-DNA-T family
MKKKNENKETNIEVLLGIVAIILVLLSVIIISGMLGGAGDGGNFLYESLFYSIGILSYLSPFLLMYAAYMIWQKKGFSKNYIKYIATTLMTISIMGTLHIISSNLSGAVGMIIAKPLISNIGTVPALLTLIAGVYISLMLITERKKIISWSRKMEAKMEEDEETKHNKKSFIHKLFIGFFGGFADINFSKKDKEEIKDDEEAEEETEESAGKNIRAKLFKEFKQEEVLEEEVEEEEDLEEEKIDIKSKKAFRLDVEFIAPPLDLLNGDKGKSSAGDTRAMSRAIENALSNFDIPVEMSGATVGPTVTQYRIKPPQGVPVRKILGLKDDIQLALSVDNIHIEAPIPGKPYVGIEVPNKDKQQLGLRDMLDTPEFKTSGNLTVAIGKNITNNPVYGDIENMPHLLIAGATKSGKSVTVQNIIMSLLYKNSPDGLKLVVIDPKKVEFTLYKGLPHLGTPVITDPKNAIKCLNWAINEMERRYEYFAEEFAGIQNLADYNKKILAPAMEKAKRRGKVEEDMPERLPYIVIIFDEFNDFMLTYPKEITTAITSLTQKGRAAGIHLILATQRPDVKVITGTIKANIPARIALKTSSAIDSRTILDQTGAEDLLGRGDMLFMDPGESRPFRVQAPFVSSEEIKSVIEYIKDSYYNYEGEKIDYSVTKDNISSSGPIGTSEGEPFDDDYLKAKDYIIATQRASASGLQSKFGWGFPKANGMIMKLEDNGVVSPLEGNKRRVLMNLNGTNDSDKDEKDSVDDLF